jgi:integrase
VKIELAHPAPGKVRDDGSIGVREDEELASTRMEWIEKRNGSYGIDADRSKVNFTPHDLRRTAASHMTGMGISRLVVSKLLNHVERGVTAVYDRHSYDQEKRAALEAWGSRLERIIGSDIIADKVTAFEVNSPMLIDRHDETQSSI